MIKMRSIKNIFLYLKSIKKKKDNYLISLFKLFYSFEKLLFLDIKNNRISKKRKNKNENKTKNVQLITTFSLIFFLIYVTENLQIEK